MHFGLEWWWQLWCGLMTLLILTNGTLDVILWILRIGSTTKAIWAINLQMTRVMDELTAPVGAVKD